jgi:hypothetical protein
MKSLRLLSLLPFLITTAVVSASEPARPEFQGEAWAAVLQSQPLKGVTVYWVFDDDAFHEYVYFPDGKLNTSALPATDEPRIPMS